ncbi:hypothetical protein [Umezawaea beigongshangensis]|uniref:hypothetical protein n=1 Tax=Umezawaea beigongshangensis TaxID=2780383 RepID=UPI0018F14247|nr:hypothetical protein [Umezawaea beigongshangensis]
MRGRGITYDTGFVNGGASTRGPLDPDVVRREMRVIHDDLHCTAVRVTGGDPDALELAATLAADAGLEVWFSPFTCDLTTDALLDVLADCADRAERLRGRGAEVVFVTGAELSLFTAGFLPGDVCTDRLDLLLGPRAGLGELLAGLPDRMNDFLGEAVAVVRARFGGRVTYASIPFEGVDWTPFDLVSVDLYRTAEIAEQYRGAVRGLVARGKPVAITEFGCTTHRGAAAEGARGDRMIEWGEDRMPVGLIGEHVRDEDEQAAHLLELLDVFEAEDVDTAFVVTFASYHLPHRDDPREDLDVASYGVVKVLEGRTGDTYPGLPWEPKVAFRALADRYRA